MKEYLDLLRSNKPFRFLWLAAVASYAGDWFNLIASAELITSLTSTGTALSFLFLARFLPSFFLSPVAGVLADRFDRRKLMIVADLARAVIVLCFLFVREAGDIWLLYLLTVLQFSLSSLFVPAKSATLSNLVTDDELVTANAVDSTTWSTMLAVGSLLGGIATGLFGSTTAFVIDALTFVASAYFLTRIPAESMEKQETDTSSGGMLAFVDGLRYLWGVPFILALALAKAAGSIVWGAMNIVEVDYASEIFPIGEGGATTLGIFYAVSGIGTGVGPIVLRRWFGDTLPKLRQAMQLCYVLLLFGMTIVAAAPALPIFVVGTFVRTVGTGGLWVFTSALLQRLVPDRFRGRVFAFEFAALTLTQSISILWAGWGQDWLGLDVRQIAWSMAGLSMLPIVVWFVVDRLWARSETQVAITPG